MSRMIRIFVVVLAGAGGLSICLWAWWLRVPSFEVPDTHGTIHRDSIETGGLQRTFAFYLPGAPRANPPLVLVLHGSSMNGALMRRATGYDFDMIADREGVIVAYPDGYGGHWNDCRAAGRYPARDLGVDDVAFLRALMAWFEGKHAVPTGQVVAMGFSNGGQMAYRLALEMPESVRAVAAVAANLPAPENQACVPAGRPVPTMIVNGTKDPLNPYTGGEVSLYGVLFRRGTVESSEITARYWLELGGEAGLHLAQERLVDTNPRDGTVTERWSWSRNGRPYVELLAVEGGGHTIPHPGLRFPRIFGRTGHDFSTAERVWNFFELQLDEPRPEVATSLRTYFW